MTRLFVTISGKSMSSRFRNLWFYSVTWNTLEKNQLLLFFFLLYISTLRHSELSSKQWLLSDSLNCPTTVQRCTRNSEYFLMEYIVKTASGGILPFTLVQFRFFNYLFLNTTTMFFTSGFWMFLHVCLWLLKGNDSLGDCGQKSWYWNVKFSFLAVITYIKLYLPFISSWLKDVSWM